MESINVGTQAVRLPRPSCCIVAPLPKRCLTALFAKHWHGMTAWVVPFEDKWGSGVALLHRERLET